MINQNEKELLINELNSSKTSSYKKIANIFELMNIADQESLNALYKSIKKDPCELVRHEAIFALGEMAGGKQTVDFLKEIIENDSSQVVQHEALIAIGTIGDKEDIDFLTKYIEDDKFEISCSAKIGIQRLIQEKGFEDKINKNLTYYLTHLFDYKNSTQNERIQILFQLMLQPTESNLEVIRKCLKGDICRIVRHEAGFVLGEIGNERSIEIMGEILENEQTPIVIHETLFALGTAGKKEAIKYIEPFIESQDYVISESAKIALDRINFLENPYSGARHFN